ncbi:vegetative cell wall protein gp1-like [Rhinolophus ferrumequinum]|uniref:vegetative cell wall protein gp1-like n=1 Tax=Rhinolophus ferrumequinum TaxID=59479 RepID=UPI00140FF83A|nr:vegetative cell wall protein gp1-like [Rhinolophus ferrumequinum]
MPPRPPTPQASDPLALFSAFFAVASQAQAQTPTLEHPRKWRRLSRAARRRRRRGLLRLKPDDEGSGGLRFAADHRSQSPNLGQHRWRAPGLSTARCRFQLPSRDGSAPCSPAGVSPHSARPRPSIPRPRGPALTLSAEKPLSRPRPYRRPRPRPRPRPRLGRTSPCSAAGPARVSALGRLPFGPSPHCRGLAAPGRRPAGGPPYPL